MKSVDVKEMVYSLGAEVCGIANVERFSDAPVGFHPKDIFPNTKSVIVYGKQNLKGLFEMKTNVPYTLARNKLLELMDDISFALTYKLEEEGCTAIPVPSAEPYEFWDSVNRHGRGILSLKHAGRLAGLGCMGKNTLLVNEKYGNRLWLGAVLTDAVLEPDAMTGNYCPESCTICLDACPKAALNGVTIEQIKCREIFASFTEGGGLILSCNTCRKVCPFANI